MGDRDLLLPRDRIDAVEAALLGAGWEWVKPDPYDDVYYRRWMHELPPLIHRARDRMIDVHHTLLPLPPRITPGAAHLLPASVVLGHGRRMPAPPDLPLPATPPLVDPGDPAG